MNSLGWICLDLGKIDKALHYFKKAQRLPGHAAKRIAPLGYAHTKAGNIEEAKKCLEKLKKRAKIEKDLELNLDFAILYTGLKNYDKVFYHLEKAYQNHYGDLVFLRLPFWKEIYNDARFNNLLQRIGLEN